MRTVRCSGRLSCHAHPLPCTPPAPSPLWIESQTGITRMHSSRMRTARSLIVSLYLVVSHARPPGATMHTPQEQPHTPPRATMHAPLGATMHAPGSNHTCPPRSNHACPPGVTTHAPQEQWPTPPREQPCMPPQEQPCMPPLWTEWQTGVKILPCPKLRLRAVKTLPFRLRTVKNSSFYEFLASIHYISYLWQKTKPAAATTTTTTTKYYSSGKEKS